MIELLDEIPWWKKTSIYQIYPRSYMDSTGNGIGDLSGIISKLDYIQDLGVETIWFSPFYPSPTMSKSYKEHDCGYDITDYLGINPEYGTMDDFDELLEGIHGRGMKIIMDMVMNHTSSEHPWFKESRTSLDNPKRDWYIWRDGKKSNGKKPPNNWKSMILKSAWKYDELTKQWYYHEFLHFQPDLNYRNPEVQKEMVNTVKFWLKKGIDGYRLDIINALFEDSEFRDEPFTLKPFSENLDLLFRSSKYQLNHPDTLEFCIKLRSTIDEFPNKFLVGEVAASMEVLKKYLGDIKGNTNTGLNTVFAFQTTSTPNKAKKFRNLINLYEKWFPDPYIPTIVFGNHDQCRRISKIGGSLEKMKLNCALQLTVRGIPYIYYGEEIGILNAKIHKKNSKDAVSHHFNYIPQFLRNFISHFGQIINRDECRTPMQWDTSANAGFSKAGIETWLPINEKTYKDRNVKIQEENKDSLLNCYRRFLKLRKETPALQSGSISLLSLPKISKRLLAYKREINLGSESQSIHVFLNMNKKAIDFRYPSEERNLLISTTIDSNPVKNDKITLLPWEGVVMN